MVGNKITPYSSWLRRLVALLEFDNGIAANPAITVHGPRGIYTVKHVRAYAGTSKSFRWRKAERQTLLLGLKNLHIQCHFRFNRFSDSTRISSGFCFRLPLALCTISIISFQFHQEYAKTYLADLHCAIFRDIAVELMLLCAYSTKLLNDTGSQFTNGILHTIVLGERGKHRRRRCHYIIRWTKSCGSSRYKQLHNFWTSASTCEGWLTPVVLWVHINVISCQKNLRHF